jgi:peptide/nickel transport system permease protein
MFRFLVRRLLTAFAVGVTLSIVTFLLLFSAVDPAAAIAGEEATAEEIEAIRKQLGVDRPLTEQYVSWCASVLSGDFGQSWYWKQPVAGLIAEHAPVTILLALMGLGVTVVVAVPLGIVAAMRANSPVDRIAVSFALAAQAVPTFWLGVIAIYIFALQLKWLPVSGDDTFAHLIMPAVVLGLASVPAVMRLTRAGLIEVLKSDYIRTARAKGLTPGRIILRHALRNAILPVISVLALQLGSKLSGSVVTESVFAVNGVGRLALQSILAADVPTVQMLVFIFAMVFVFLNVISDLINAWLDPRIRMG